MADVDMADAPPAKTKVAKAGGASADSDKKRFEVKKVSAVEWNPTVGEAELTRDSGMQ
jgi:hypothetical protein